MYDLLLQPTSSERSPQSLSPSHCHVPDMQWPLLQRNCELVQLPGSPTIIIACCHMIILILYLPHIDTDSSSQSLQSFSPSHNHESGIQSFDLLQKYLPSGQSSSSSSPEPELSSIKFDHNEYVKNHIITCYSILSIHFPVISCLSANISYEMYSYYCPILPFS